MRLGKEEIGRKILHIFSGTLIPGGIFYIPLWTPKLSWVPQSVSPKLWPVIILGVITAGMLLVEFIRIRMPNIGGVIWKLFGSMMRPNESREMTGATWIFASAFICSLVFFNHPHISVVVLSTFIWGDAIAAIVGLSIGRIKIGKKSLEGSMACFALCMIMYHVLFPLAPGLLDAWNGRVPLIPALVGSVCVTIMELFPIKVADLFSLNDNLTVPVITGLILVWIEPWVVG